MHACTHADQPARMVAIAAGSVGGGLFFLVLLITFMAIVVVVVLQKHKWKTFNLTTNVAYTRRSAEELDNTYDSITESNTIVAKQSNGEDFTLSTEQNVAYDPSAIPCLLYTSDAADE